MELNRDLIHALSLLMILTSFAAAESRNLRHATVAYIAQACLICGLLAAYSAANEALLWWAATALATKAVLVPVFLWRGTAGAEQETRPLIGFAWSFVIIFVVGAAMYKFTHTHAAMFVSTETRLQELAETNLAVAFTIFVLGLYAIFTRRDAIKTVIGLCLLENGVHLGLVSLAPTIKETALAGIATEVVVTVGLLVYIISGIREKFGSTDTSQLSELHW